jgi:hypothetical protein
MPKPPTADMIALGLTVPERLLLFCLATGTDWQAASITHATAHQMMVRPDRPWGRRDQLPADRSRPRGAGGVAQGMTDVRFERKRTSNAQYELFRV